MRSAFLCPIKAFLSLALRSLLRVALHPDLLDHEDGVGYRKAYQGDGHQGDEMGDDHHKALSQRQRVLKPGRKDLFPGTLKHE